MEQQTGKRKRETTVPGPVGLHREVERLALHLSSTPEQHTARLGAVGRVRRLVNGLWPRAELHLVGSFRTGLHLPSSDLDLVVLGRWAALPLRTLERHLLAGGLARPGSLEVLPAASVPIVKFTDSETGFKVDISFNTVDGLVAAQLVNTWKLELPALRPLVLLLKQLLLERDLATVYTGGLSSHCLTVMVVSFLQLHPRRREANANLGVLLLELLHLYGRDFNYAEVALGVRGTGGLLARAALDRAGDREVAAGAVAVQSPLLPRVNMARASHRTGQVTAAFSWAHGVLARAMRLPAEGGQPCLGRVLRVLDL